MNEGIEDRLRQLRPGALPAPLAQRLDQPPKAFARRARLALRLSLGAAAAAAVVLFAWRQTPPEDSRSEVTSQSVIPTSAFPEQPDVPPAFTAPSGFAGAHTMEVTGVRPVSVITDESNRPWRLIEVNWVEEDTYVFASHPAVVRTQDQFRTVVPVALRLD